MVDTQGTGKMTDAGGAFRICGGYVLMTGGTIENCTTFGGVYIKQGGTFKMTGGTLKNNTSYAGVLWYGEKYPASIYSSTSKDGTVIIDGTAQVLCCDQDDCDHFGSIYILSNQTTLRVDGGTIKGGIYTEGTSIITSSRTGTGEGTAIQGKVENGGTISGGTYDDEVKNEAAGTISGGSFAGKVTNAGSISGGTFHSEVDNQGAISGGTYSENSVVKNTGTITGGTFLGTVESENGTIEDSAKVSVRFVNETGETLKTLRVLRGQRITSTDLPEIDPTQYGYAKVKYTVGGKEYRDNSEFTDAVRYTEDETLVTVTLISPIAYTITYNLNDGFVSSSDPFESNPTEYFSTSDDITLTNPTKEGYTFTGWGGTGLEGTNNMTVTIPKGSTGNREYTAYYMKRPSGDISSNYFYTVVYDTQGGSPVAPKTVWLGDISKVEVLDGVSTTRAGYWFSVWYCGSTRIALANTTVEKLKDNADDNGVITLTASWKEKTEVSFNTAAQEYTYAGAEQAFEIRDTTLDGFQVTYRQNGNTVAAPTDAGSYDVIVTREEDRTYKAVDVTIPDGLVIQPQKITVTIGDTSDQTYTGKAIEPAITVSDGTNEIPASEYTVAYTDNRNAGTATVTVTAKAGGNYTFTQATQTFTIQKKSITPTIAMAGYDYGTDPGYPEVSGNEGGGAVSVWYSTYDDIGTDTAHRQLWDVAAIGGTTLNAGTYYMMAEVAESQNYTAGISDVITFRVMANQYAAPAAPALDGSTVTVGEADRGKALEYSLNGGAWTDVPALDNGSFVLPGLAENTGFTLSLRQKASADGNYAASDAVGCFSVTYNANGGTGTVPCAYANSGSTVTVASGAELQRTGYTFAGWNTEADGSGTAYAEGLPITTAATLYAQWTINQYTITFDTDDGTKIAPITLDYGETVTAPENPTKTGYTFVGWDDTIPNIMPAKNMTITARWTINQYTITFDTDDGTKIAPITLDYGETVTAPENPTKTGYTFVGWDDTIPNTMPAKNMTITAQWRINQYTITLNPNYDGGESGTMTTGDGWKLTDDLPVPTRSGYTFDGWFTAVTGGEQVAADTVFNADITIYAHWTARPTGGGSSSSTTTEKNPDGSTTVTVTDKTTGTVTETTKNTDGSTIVVETKKDGTVTETNKAADGTTGTVVTDKNGDITESSVSVSDKAAAEAAKTGDAVTLPVEVPAAKSTEDAPAVEVTVPQSAGSVKVEIPVEKVTPGTVAVIVKADGTEEIIANSIPTETGVVLTLDGSATVKIVDNSKEFEDVQTGYWGEDAVDFVVAREMFAGTSETTFSPNSNMTRAMLMTVLARFDGQDTDGGDVWYEKGMEWAKENGISDGSNPNGNITREQLATMLWRYAGSPTSSHSLDGYTDAAQISDYAQEAMRWANENGIINGYGDGTLGAKDNATRAQVAQMLMTFIKSLNQ
ncbi:MAG: InlB B-repeat-containing protein [Bacillota bacterium]|nr:InlB B-repeat-containing protein [Bacillota bacterium]